MRVYMLEDIWINWKLRLLWKAGLRNLVQGRNNPVYRWNIIKIGIMHRQE